MKARILRNTTINGVDVTSNTVIEAGPALIAVLKGNGSAEDAPAEVAFALSEGARTVVFESEPEIERAVDRPQRRRKGS